MRPKRVVLTPQSDDNGISVLQKPTAASNLTITGALASGGAVTLNHGHLILITCAGNDAGRTFTVTGTDDSNRAISEAISGADTAASQGSVYFKTVTQIAVDAATAGNIIVGVNGLSASKWYHTDVYLNSTNIGFSVELSGTATYSAQHTMADIWNLDDISGITVLDHDSLVDETTSDDGNYAFPMVAMRVRISAYTSGTVTLSMLQAG